ncbi:MAG: hypothetical protein QM729_21325 [Solirubrobacterales bacterium]
MSVLITTQYDQEKLEYTELEVLLSGIRPSTGVEETLVFSKEGRDVAVYFNGVKIFRIGPNSQVALASLLTKMVR